MARALIVDDKAENLYFLSAMLAGNGYQVEKAGNGADALTAARRVLPDLVISDILMPGMDGFALCRQWRQDPQLREIPFVFYTATYTDPKDEQLALSLGADLFLIKPREPEEFMSAITEVMRRHAIGQLRRRNVPLPDEAGYLREYNAALVHKLEDKLVELERANRAKDILLGSVSHELRTPLTPALGLVDLLARDPRNSPELREDLEMVRRHIEIEKHLIGDLIDFAAIQSGEVSLRQQPLSLHELVREAAALWREHVQSKELHLVLRLDAAADRISADRRRLEQVLWNVMYHAVGRTPQNGSIVFTTSNPTPVRVALEVRDGGAAMDEQSIQWAFSPFECGNRMGERGRSDIGLGLAVTKAIVEGHGGTVRIQSEAGVRGVAVISEFPAYGE